MIARFEDQRLRELRDRIRRSPEKGEKPLGREAVYAMFAGPREGAYILWFDGDWPYIGTAEGGARPLYLRAHDLTGREHRVSLFDYWIVEGPLAKDGIGLITGHLQNNACIPEMKDGVTEKNAGWLLRTYPALCWLHHQMNEYHYRTRETAEHHRPADKRLRRVGVRPPRFIGDTKTRNPDADNRHLWLNWLFKAMANYSYALPKKIAETISKEYHQC